MTERRLTARRDADSEDSVPESFDLVGAFFHSFNEDGKTVAWQGQVISKVTDEIYLVLLFDWLVGQESIAKLVRLRDMLGWQFYRTNTDMNFWYQYRYHRPKRREDEQ